MKTVENKDINIESSAISTETESKSEIDIKASTLPEDAKDQKNKKHKKEKKEKKHKKHHKSAKKHSKTKTK